MKNAKSQNYWANIGGNGMVKQFIYRVDQTTRDEIDKSVNNETLIKPVFIEQQLMRELDNCLRKDPVQARAIDMTKLYLVEITRKKVEKPLWEQVKNS